MAKPKAEILIDLNIASALGGLNELSDSIDATMKHAQQSIRGLSAAWTAAVSVVRLVVSNLAKWAEKAAEVDRIERSLAAAAKLRGDATGIATRGLLAYNAQLEKKLGVDADELATLQKRLLAMGVSVTRVQEATKATLGLAEVTGSLDSAAVAVGKAYVGNTKSLERWVGKSKDADDAIAKASKNFSILEANAASYTTQIKVLEHGLEGMEEEAGKAVIANKDLAFILSKLNSVIATVTPALSTLVDWYLKIESIPIRIVEFYRNNNIFAFMIEDSVEAETALRNVAAAQQILAAGAPIEESGVLSDPRLARSAEEGAGSGRKGKIIIPNPKGSRLNPSQTKKDPSLESLLSDSASAILEGGQQLNEIDQEIFEQSLNQIRTYNEVRAKLETDGLDFRLQLQREARERIRQNELDAAADREDILQQESQQALQQQGQFWTNMAQVSIQGAADVAVGFSEGWREGTAQVVKLLGSLAATLASYLIPMATATTASGVAASTIGTPAAVVTGPALAAAVATFLSAGTGLAASLLSRGRQAQSSASSGRVPTFSPRPFTGRSVFDQPGIPRSGEIGSVTYFIEFNGVVAGDADRLSREVRHLLRRAERLHPGGGR